MSEIETVAPAHPSFGEALRFWLKLGFISFGGPTGQIAIMHDELVERKRWIDEDRFLHALNYCMLLPGPEAQQLATYIGWLLHRTAGGIVAGALFVLPSALLLWVLSYIYVVHGNVPWIAAIFAGLKPVVVAIVAHAVVRIGRKSLKNGVMWCIAAAAFAAIALLHAPFPAIILAAGLIGLIGGTYWKSRFVVLKGHGAKAGHAPTPVAAALDLSHTQPSLGRVLRVLVVCAVLWGGPIAAAWHWLGREHAVTQQGVFFSKAAMVTFGGAYAVLPYVAQQAVEHYGWLAAPQMLDGLGLAETTPGPLIMVLQFVGFLGGWHQPGSLSPLLAATLGAAMTMWVTFLPCFLWIFLGAPYVERMRDNQRITAALSCITAAVVGVVLNLAVWFGWHVLLPNWQPDWVGWAMCLAALVALVRFDASLFAVVGGGALLGLLRYALGF